MVVNKSREDGEGLEKNAPLEKERKEPVTAWARWMCDSQCYLLAERLSVFPCSLPSALQAGMLHEEKKA